MAVLPAAITVDYIKFLPMLTGDIIHPGSVTNPLTTTWAPTIKWFKMAEGGWILNNEGARVRRVAVPELRMKSGLQYTDPVLGGSTYYLQALDAEVDLDRNVIDPTDPPRYDIPVGKGSRYVSAYHDLSPSDFQWLSPGTLQVTCLLDFDQENDDGAGFSPDFCELGLYADHPLQSGGRLLVAYCTFPKETKDVTRQLENVVKVVYG